MQKLKEELQNDLILNDSPTDLKNDEGRDHN